MRALAHKNIVRCLGIHTRYWYEPERDSENTICYIVMEKMDENLKQYLVESPESCDRNFEFVWAPALKQLITGLQYIHEKGITSY